MFITSLYIPVRCAVVVAVASDEQEKNRRHWVSTNTESSWRILFLCLPERFCVVTFTLEEWFWWNEKLKKQTPNSKCWGMDERMVGWPRVVFGVLGKGFLFIFIFVFFKQTMSRIVFASCVSFYSTLCHFVDKAERIQRWHIREQWVRLCVLWMWASERTGGWIIAFR